MFPQITKKQIIVAVIALIIIFVVTFLFFFKKGNNDNEDFPPKDNETSLEEEKRRGVDLSTTLEDAEKIAEEDVNSTSITYQQRGVSDSLRLIESSEEDGFYKIKFGFISVYEGYGRATEEGLLKGDFSERTIEVLMYYNQPLSVIVDGIFDEIEGVFIEEKPEEELIEEESGKEI